MVFAARMWYTVGGGQVYTYYSETLRKTQGKTQKRKGCEMANRERVQRIVRRLERMEESKLEIVEKVVLILAAADVRTAARIHQMALSVWRAAK